MAEGAFGEVFSAEHASDFFGSQGVFKADDLGEGSSVLYPFGDGEVGASANGDLRQVGDGDQLMGAADLRQFGADIVGDLAADVGVDLVGAEQGNSVVPC